MAGPTVKVCSWSPHHGADLGRRSEASLTDLPSRTQGVYGPGQCKGLKLKTPCDLRSRRGGFLRKPTPLGAERGSEGEARATGLPPGIAA